MGSGGIGEGPGGCSVWEGKSQAAGDPVRTPGRLAKALSASNSIIIKDPMY